MKQTIFATVLSSCFVIACSSGNTSSSEGNLGETGELCTKAKLQTDTTKAEELFNMFASSRPYFQSQRANVQIAGVLGDTAILVDIQAPEIVELTASGVATQVLVPENATDFARDYSVITANPKANEEAVVWGQQGEIFAFIRATKTMHLLVAKADSFAFRDINAYAGYVYFNGAKKEEGTAEHMWRIPLTGGQPEMIIDDFLAWDWDMSEDGHIYLNGDNLQEYNPDGSLNKTLKPGFYVSQAEVGTNTIAYRSGTGINYVASLESPTKVTKILDFSDDLYGFIADGTDFFADYSSNLLHANPINGVCKEYTNIHPMQNIPQNHRLWINTISSISIITY